MVAIAVAGGTRGIGRAIAETIQRQGKHDVKILSRTENLKVESESGCEVIPVDYDNVENLTKVLIENKIDTVISTLFLTTTGAPQTNLIHASEASQYTRRFIPSIWGIPYTKDQLKNFPIGLAKLEALEALEKSSLEYTLFYVGYFLDFWGHPHVKTYQLPNIIAVDIEHNVAAIPGTGDTPVTFTHTFDVAEFVAASLELPKWDRESYVIGETVTWNEFVRIAEDVKGTKFKVTYDSLDLLRSGKVTELPSHLSLYEHMPKEEIQSIFSVFGIWFHEGLFNLQPKKRLNDVFPHIKAYTVRELLESAWKGR
ncbi:NmrA-like family protein [Lasiodiplodia theobromae]|uniref:NmrA-like family protein n=1 Tax=Lasiodiplodia theobromae TaxID=45133 RepID=UPI0015C3C2F4|nr:NmrA-like family protein [Lasiodiplodia theobromae]KAF4540747.1 NmrA-like family protein [Lasiodiplodia theobromae]